MSTPAANVDAGQQGTDQGAEPTGPDFSPVMDRIDQIEATIGPVAEWVQSQQAEPEAQGEDYTDFINRLFAGDEGAAQAQAEPEQVQPPIADVFRDPQKFEALMDRAVQERLDRTVAPELEAARQDRFQREVADVMERYPALKEAETAQPVVLAAQQFAQELAQRLGQPELADQLWRQPGVIEHMYLAEQARQTSGAEVPAGANGGEARLEGANGANPGADQPPLAEQIIQAHNGSPSGFQWF